MSYIAHIEPQNDAAKRLLTDLVMKEVPVLGVRTRLYPKQMLIVMVNQVASVHVRIPEVWDGFPVIVSCVGDTDALN